MSTEHQSSLSRLSEQSFLLLDQVEMELEMQRQSDFLPENTIQSSSNCQTQERVRFANYFPSVEEMETWCSLFDASHRSGKLMPNSLETADIDCAAHSKDLIRSDGSKTQVIDTFWTNFEMGRNDLGRERRQGYRAVICRYCGRSFPSKTALMNHISREHPGQPVHFTT